MQSVIGEYVISELTVELLIHNTSALYCKYIMNIILLAEYYVAILHSPRDVTTGAILHFPVRNLVRAIANFKLQIATIKIFICTCRPYSVQILTLAY